MKVAVIIPCYNEEASIKKVVDGLRSVSLTEQFELFPIVVNDCSTDTTLDVIKKLEVVYLNLAINLGIGGAVQAGFKYALNNNFDIAVQLDGDGQHPAEQISELIKPILCNELDVIIGSRFISKEGFQSTFFRRLGINYFKWLNKILIGKRITDSTSGFRAINRNALEIVCNYYPDDYPEPEALILYSLNDLRIGEIPVVMKERSGGVSSIRSYKSIYYMVKVTLAMLFVYVNLKFNGKRSAL
jgi:glycosyltransferase involved in cell wall biosynthesis